MKLKEGKITILFDHDGMSIELIDGLSTIHFAKVRLNPEQTVRALSRLGYCPCEIEVVGLDHVGKKLEHKDFEFEMVGDSKYSMRDTEKAKKLAKKLCPSGWKPDLYFNSQDSFSYREGKRFAKTKIRRWVEIDA